MTDPKCTCTRCLDEDSGPYVDPNLARLQGRRDAFAEAEKVAGEIVWSRLPQWIEQQHLRAQLEVTKAGGK